MLCCRISYLGKNVKKRKIDISVFSLVVRGQCSKPLLYFYLISEEDKREDNEDPDIAKIKKVQSFFRGWLCRWVAGPAIV